MTTKTREKQEDSYYTSFMNTVYDLPWKKIGAYVLVASLILAPAMAVAVATLTAQANDQCMGDTCLADRMIEPCIGEDCPVASAFAQMHFASALPAFPNWYHNQIIFDAAALTHVDLQYQGQIVTSAEVITEEFETISTRQYATFNVLHQISEMPINEMSEIVTRIFNSAPQRGVMLTLDERVFSFGIDPKSVENHNAALEFIEQNLLNRNDFTAEELETHLNSLHRIFAKDSQAKGGKYRDGVVVLQGDNVGIGLKETVEIVRRKEPQAVNEFKRIYNRFFQASNSEQALKSFTKEEKRVLSLAIDVDFPFPDQVSKKMKQFCHDYVAKLRENIPTVDFAAWIHDTLIGIHPWEDWNGHVSRALMNGELARRGHLPFLIFNVAEYNEAVRSHRFKGHLVETQEKVQKLAEQLTHEEPMKKVLVQV